MRAPRPRRYSGNGPRAPGRLDISPFRTSSSLTSRKSDPTCIRSISLLSVRLKGCPFNGNLAHISVRHPANRGSVPRSEGYPLPYLSMVLSPLQPAAWLRGHNIHLSVGTFYYPFGLLKLRTSN